MEPQYNQNPLTEKGSLDYTDFGWALLDNLKACGFKEAYAIAYFSALKGYIGGGWRLGDDIPIIFEAIK